MDKIVKYLKENKQLAIIVGTVAFILILFIVALLPDLKKTDLALIEQPLYFYQKRKITIPNDVVKKYKVDRKYEIYRVKNDNLNIKVEGIMSQLTINAPTKTNYANIAYSWNNKAGDTVEYDVKNQSMWIKLSNRVNIFPDLVSPSDTQLNELLNRFVQKYVNPKFVYSDYLIERNPGSIKVSGRRVQNGIPLQVPGLVKNYDYIELDDREMLKSARILLAEFNEEAESNLKVVTPKQLVNVIKNPRYPKDINDGKIEGINDLKSLTDPKVMTDDIENGTLPYPLFYTAKDIEIVYLFANTNQQFLTPVYRLNVSGRIEYKGQEHNVNGIVNASAIDPDYVYVPANILYAD